MSREGGSKGVTNNNYVGSGIQYGKARLGGSVIRLKAGVALKLGDAVYCSADETVSKSATSSNHDEVMGVVVGGENTNFQVIEDSAAYNVMTAADANEDVLIQISGICYVICAAAIAAGQRLVLDTGTAGRAKAAADVTVTSTGLTITGAPAIGTLAVSGAPAIGTLVVSGAPAIGTLDATVDAGAVAVTSSAANGAIATVTGAPAIGTLAVSGAPAIGTLAVSGAPAVGTLAVSGSGTVAGDGFARIFAKLLQASSNAGDIRKALLFFA